MTDEVARIAAALEHEFAHGDTSQGTDGLAERLYAAGLRLPDSRVDIAEPGSGPTIEQQLDDLAKELGGPLGTDIRVERIRSALPAAFREYRDWGYAAGRHAAMSTVDIAEGRRLLAAADRALAVPHHDDEPCGCDECMAYGAADLPIRVIVDQHGHYWRDYGGHLSMPPVSDENVETEVFAVYDRPESRSEAWDRGFAAGRQLDVERLAQAFNNEMGGECAVAMPRWNAIAREYAALSGSEPS